MSVGSDPLADAFQSISDWPQFVHNLYDKLNRPQIINIISPCLRSRSSNSELLSIYILRNYIYCSRQGYMKDKKNIYFTL